MRLVIARCQVDYVGRLTAHLPMAPRLLLGKAKGKREPLESVAGGRLRLVEPDAETALERLTDSFHRTFSISLTGSPW